MNTPQLSPFHPSAAAVHSPPSSVSFPISVISSLGVMWSSSPPLSSSLPSHPTSLSLPLCSISLIQIPNSTDRAALKGANSPTMHDIIYLCKCPLSHVPTHYYTTAFPSFHLDTEVHAFLSAKMYAIGMIELSLDVVSMLLNPLQACSTIHIWKAI